MSSRMSTRSRRRAKSCPPPQRPPTYGPLATIPDRGFLVDPDAPLRGFPKRKQNIGTLPLSSDSLGTPAEPSPDDVADTSTTSLPTHIPTNAKETSCETQDDAQPSAVDVRITPAGPVTAGEQETTGGIAACPSSTPPIQSDI